MDILIITLIAGGMTCMLLVVFSRIRVQSKKSYTITQSINDDKIMNYNHYRMTKNERIFNSLLAGTFLFLIGFIFYQNLILSLLFSLLGLYYPKFKTKSLIQKRKDNLKLQFKQALYSLSSSLSAGKSVENSFREVSKDLRFLYPDPKTYIIREFDIITRRVDNGESIEHALLDLANRSGIEDVQNFADVFTTCKRTGGDLVEVIRRTTEIIGEKLDIQQDIYVLLAQKRFESNILLVSPLIIVALLSMSSPDYMEPLYSIGFGPIVMTTSLVLLVATFIWVKKIMDIKV